MYLTNLQVWASRIPLALFLILTGCATAAQMQLQQASNATREAVTNFKACVKEVVARTEYATLLPYTVALDTNQPSMALLTNENLPTPQEARLVAARHDVIMGCRSQLLKSFEGARPDLVPVLVNLMTRTNVVAVDLVERKITWGNATRQAQAASAETQQAIAVANKQWLADLNASHQAELAHRQAAAQALMEWSLQQQMINAVNRPVMTSCNRFGSMVNCTTQ